MAERNEKVMEKVREELTKDPAMKSKPLYEQMQKLDKSIGDLSVQQFHARYVLPIKREHAPKRPRKRKSTAKGSASRRRSTKQEAHRKQLRGVFLEFAKDLADAEERGEIVRVMADLESYVDRATGS